MSSTGRDFVPDPRSRFVPAKFRRTSIARILLTALLVGGCSASDDDAHPSGTLEATVVDVAPMLTARILEVRADEGEDVAAGDTLIVLDTELLARQRRQTAARQDVLAAQQRETTEGIRQARLRESLAATTFQRLESLQRQGSVTLQQLDEARAAKDLAASEVQAARNREAALEAQGVELEAALGVLHRQLADGIVVSPIDGTVLLRSAEPGEVARAGVLALRLADLRALDLRVFLEASELDRVRLGQTFPVEVDALPDRELRGTVSWISTEAEFTPKNAQTRKARAQLVYALKLKVENPDRVLHIGMPASVRIP